MKTRKGAGSERGNVMIETAFIIIPLMTMLMGIVNICMLVFIQGAFQNAAREGVRWAITYSSNYKGQACSSQNACIQQVVEDNSFGFLNSSNTSLIHVNYYAPFSLATPLTSVPVASTDPNYSNVNYLNQSGNVVEVAITGYQWSWIAPISGFTPLGALALGANSSDVLGGYAAGTMSPPSP